jgi:hypothetical protein
MAHEIRGRVRRGAGDEAKAVRLTTVRARTNGESGRPRIEALGTPVADLGLHQEECHISITSLSSDG